MFLYFREYSLANLDDYETHFTVMNYKDDVQLKQVRHDSMKRTLLELAFWELCRKRSGAFYRLQRSCGKVMFSQACVKNSVHRGVCIPACTRAETPSLGRHPPPEQTPPCPVHAGIHTPTQCMLGYTNTPPLPSAFWDIPPLPPTATAGDGTHPTGMHSC